jgi:ketosteroid isomerase-like protein
MRRLLLALATLCVALPIAAQAPAAPNDPDRKAIEAAMNAQVAAWNHADIPAFMQIYENSPDTTFIGAHIAKGFTPILDRYKASYSTAEQMGTLTFSNLEVRLLTSSCGKAEFAVVTGNFHLERTAKGTATKDDGTFSLVWRKGPQGWKILLDHTS